MTYGMISAEDRLYMLVFKNNNDVIACTYETLPKAIAMLGAGVKKYKLHRISHLEYDKLRRDPSVRVAV